MLLTKMQQALIMMIMLFLGVQGRRNLMLDENGGYTGLLVWIEDPVDHSEGFLDNLKVNILYIVFIKNIKLYNLLY